MGQYLGRKEWDKAWGLLDKGLSVKRLKTDRGGRGLKNPLLARKRSTPEKGGEPQQAGMGNEKYPTKRLKHLL